MKELNMNEINRATRSIVSILGAFFAIGGIDHGVFEILHGNVPTTGLFIQAIGLANRFWVYGTEDAFTLIPNFLLTGILAVFFSLAIMVWLIGFIDRPHGPSVFFLLFVCLFLVGGGVGQVFFFIPAWAVSTRIHSPLTFWRKALPQATRRRLARLWPTTLVAGVLCFLVALEIAIFGFVPGVIDPNLKNYICWFILAAGLVAILFTFVAGFAHDILAKNQN
jgi:hypothetical protein